MGGYTALEFIENKDIVEQLESKLKECVKVQKYVIFDVQSYYKLQQVQIADGHHQTTSLSEPPVINFYNYRPVTRFKGSGARIDEPFTTSTENGNIVAGNREQEISVMQSGIVENVTPAVQPEPEPDPFLEPEPEPE